ncbi:MAG TPA: pilus assembly protein PilV [Burkholderiaceae bacterium]|nr:pilus assembly protein PilV [Burkholderiaceae bacterium]
MLVSTLVFAVGVLGIVGLQAGMTRAQTQAKLRGDATYLAAELVGLMWADRPNLALYASAQCPTLARCQDWSQKVGRALPGASTAVTVNATSGVVTIAISWTTGQGTQTYRSATAVTS